MTSGGGGARGDRIGGEVRPGAGFKTDDFVEEKRWGRGIVERLVNKILGIRSPPSSSYFTYLFTAHICWIWSVIFRSMGLRLRQGTFSANVMSFARAARQLTQERKPRLLVWQGGCYDDDVINDDVTMRLYDGVTMILW